MTKLSELCDIQMGYTLRGRLEPDPKGEYCFLQPRAISSNLEIDRNELQRAPFSGKSSDSVLIPGDIIFISKGPRIGAIYLKQVPPNTVATSHFIIIRTNSKKILPEYLAWYLNNRTGEYFRKNREGTAIQQIKVNVLKESVIEILDLEQQQQIVDLGNLVKKERQLLEKLADRKEQLINSIQQSFFTK
ncbi:restriction endonuclease subunit S [Pseudobacteriovorax antillogorgiicola]|uniref:Type I restriction modification DNA specificity domain-containing protein n=1 Tax=Pseudobacteriovorax antillogorgiicola TaxID=1513793 RepID=A0A1Y6CVW4_9BACT|nr:restriction endonuclease subunit S [Pseudobacteriovorax antillogorgiicola]TCS44633.1 type I restriction modification DNA specificity protein [Pseudobacteriovorax antillogorgiicola]SMF78488.1 Type I restriction modification DNA specificity domain-containing protein [Pseudobacteriovorax antillogorgiicola]